MIRKDLISVLTGFNGITKAEASHILDHLFGQISNRLKDGEDVILKSFGTFKVKDVPARTYRNPRTGGTVDTPAKRVVKFKPSPRLI